MMDLPASLRTLLDYARAEAKRGGHGQTELIHLAAALLKIDAGRFDAAFGTAARGQLTTKLRDLPAASGPTTDSAEVLALLEQAAVAADSNAFVEEKLRTLFVATPTNVNYNAPTAPGIQITNTVATAGLSSGDFAIAERSRRFVIVVQPPTEDSDNKILAREEIVDKLFVLLSQRKPATPCVLAPRGGGKSSLFNALAARVARADTNSPMAGLPIVRIKAETVVAAERGRTLRQVLEDIGERAIIVLDDVEILAALGGTAADIDMLGVIRSVVGHSKTRAILTLTMPYFAKLEMHDGELTSALTRIELPALDNSVLRHIGEQRVKMLAAFHKVSFPPEVLEAALVPPPADSKLAHPGLLAARLDYAGACAAARDDRCASVGDLGVTTAAVKKRVLHADALMKVLAERVSGQSHAIERVARRLSLTSANLDLRPTRPDGVFLFVGPSGTGKTELARATAEAVFGDENAIIRLDMSEYAQEWALSRLVGPQPGYVGYTEPESWLTTKVRARPYSIVLLDEFEKAHPRVWTAFLQVFDAGRLTDARGETADFSDCIVVLTSNIGSRSFSSKSTGIGFIRPEDPNAAAEERVVEAVRDTMPPELINRIDEIIVFQPLGRDVIHRIAEHEIQRAFDRLSAKGYELSISPEAIELIAEGGYDPAFGARHVQRNIERTLLQTLAGQTSGKWRAEVTDGKIVWIKV